MRRLVAHALPVLAAASFVVQSGSGADAQSSTRIVDRTLRCTTGVQGGARVIYLRAQSAYGQGAQLEWLAQATVSAAGQPVPSKPNFRPTLAGMTAGWPVAPPLTAAGVGFDNRLCTPMRRRVALSGRGLTGGTASQLGDEFQCVVPKTMLVRMRVVFRAPVELERQGGSTGATGRVQRGQIAVATIAGKPLVYAEVTESGGQSRLFTSKGCT